VALCCCQTSHSCLFDYISAVVSRIYHSVVVKFTEQGNEVIAVSAIILEKSLHVTKNNERHQPKQNDEEDLPIRVLTLSLCLITCVYMCVCVWERESLFWYVSLLCVYITVWKCVWLSLQTQSFSITLCNWSNLQTRTVGMKWESVCLTQWNYIPLT
jgi:hypothetical protein